MNDKQIIIKVMKYYKLDGKFDFLHRNIAVSEIRMMIEFALELKNRNKRT